jgi:hypothetical protein
MHSVGIAREAGQVSPTRSRVWNRDNDDDEDALPSDPDDGEGTDNRNNNIIIDSFRDRVGNDGHAVVNMDAFVSDESATDTTHDDSGGGGGGSDYGATTLPLGVANDLASLEALIPKRRQSVTESVTAIAALSDPDDAAAGVGSTPPHSRVVSVAGGGVNAVRLLRIEGVHVREAEV